MEVMRKGESTHFLGEGLRFGRGDSPAFTLHTLQPLRDMRHLEQPIFTTLACPAALGASASSTAGSQGSARSGSCLCTKEEVNLHLRPLC